LLANLHRQVTARLDEIALMAGVPPVTIKDRFLFMFEDIAIEITARGYGKALLGITVEGNIPATGRQFDNTHS
jgi:hypothetical protein